MFCAPGVIFGCTEGVVSRFHVLCPRTHIRRYLGCRVPFSCFALPDSFSEVPRASGPVFIFSVPEHVFGGSESVGSCFHVLRARTRFGRYRGRRVLFSCFVLPDRFSAVPSASGPVFMFCAPELVFGVTEGIGFLFHVLSRFHVVCSRTCFWLYRGRRVPFSCFARPDSFSAVPGRRVPFSCFARPD
jgi:hypothetical protein